MMQRIVPLPYGVGTVQLGIKKHTIECGLSEAFMYQQMHYGGPAAVQAIFDVLTEDQQVRVLEQLGWAKIPQLIPPKQGASDAQTSKS
jgi:hypothetical protein